MRAQDNDKYPRRGEDVYDARDNDGHDVGEDDEAEDSVCVSRDDVHAQLPDPQSTGRELRRCKSTADEPRGADDDVAATVTEEPLVVERSDEGECLRRGHPAETVQRVEAEPPDEEQLRLGERVCRALQRRRRVRTEHAADWHHRAANGEVRHAERQHEERRAVFAQFRISRDDDDGH